MIDKKNDFQTKKLSLNNKNDYAKDLREQFKNNQEKMKKNNLIKGKSPTEKNFKVPTPLKFLSILVTIYLIYTVVLYILTFMGIPIMAI